MKTQFAIFGLEKMKSPIAEDEKSGQPYFFRKYPHHYESSDKAHEALQLIVDNKSPFPHYAFSEYIVLEVFAK
jgi:hypothetical protein